MTVMKEIIRRPIITEKATWLKENSNKYVFEVQKDCNKIEIKKAVEELFSVKVKSVRTYTTHGKIRSRGRFRGNRRAPAGDPSLSQTFIYLRYVFCGELFGGQIVAEHPVNLYIKQAGRNPKMAIGIATVYVGL